MQTCAPGFSNTASTDWSLTPEDPAAIDALCGSE